MESNRTAVAGRGAVVWLGMAFVAVTALIHLIEAPEYFEAATYLGLLFVANFAGGVVAALGIFRDASWGWYLGAVVAAGAFIAYIVSRTVGLPGLTETGFFEPLGILSLVVEAGFLVTALLKSSRR